MRAFAELSADGKRIEVHFKYSPEAVAAIKGDDRGNEGIPGRKFVNKDKGGPFWTVPLDLTTGRRLREAFGDGLVLGDAIKAWGREEVRRQRNLGSLTTADDAELENLSAEAAEWLRPYQRADVKMMALTNVLNANQPGVGKTVEVIYAVEEAQLPGPHLVIAPLTLHKDPWADELAEHAPGAEVYWGTTPAERKQAMNDALAAIEAGRTNVWLITNPDMIRVESDKGDPDSPKFAGRSCLSKDHKGIGYYAKPEVAGLFEVEWSSLTLDEFHKFGLGADRNTLFARAVHSLGAKAARRFALSGTPMGGKPIRLWGVLHFVEPDLYSSKWRWAEQWLHIDDNGFGKKIGGLIEGREEEFNKAHAVHMVRRLRKEALPGLPDKVVIDVWTEMTKSQRKAYEAFATAAEVELDGGRVSANGVLAEYARMKQFANAKCEVRDGEIHPTRDSGKVDVLLDRLDSFGLRSDNPEPGARAIVASESKRMVEMVEGILYDEGLNVKRLDGTVKGKERNAVIDWYKDLDGAAGKEARILVMTTQTGGVGLNLGMTGSVHILDETWNPDDQEQLEDRGMRNRTTALMVLYYRTKDSIQEYIHEIGEGKQINNANIMDIRAALRERVRDGIAGAASGAAASV